jgi:ribosomal protein S18 acetylase RimI-like enzyme
LSSAPRLRPAERGDVEALADTVYGGFDGYRAFAADGWEPPTREAFRDELAGHLEQDYFWCLLAEAGGDPTGHAAFMPAKKSRWAVDEPGVAHLFQLFVRPTFYGTGLANDLLSRAIEEMGARGFRVVRLFTPAGQARARRFYEREGWRAAGEAFYVEGLGLELIEYRRPL